LTGLSLFDGTYATATCLNCSLWRFDISVLLWVTYLKPVFTRLLIGQQRLNFLTIAIALHAVVAISASQHLLTIWQPAKTPDQEVEVFFIKVELPPVIEPSLYLPMSKKEAAPPKQILKNFP